MNEKEFGYQIRQALNEAAAGLDYKTTYRLEQARAAALARHRSSHRTAWTRPSDGGPSMGVATRMVRKFLDGLPIVALIRLHRIPVAATAVAGAHVRSGRNGFCRADG